MLIRVVKEHVEHLGLRCDHEGCERQIWPRHAYFIRRHARDRGWITSAATDRDWCSEEHAGRVGS